MIIAFDFDGSIVSMDGRAYEDIETPLRFMPHARECLLALKRAGHVLLLYSARANRSLREDSQFDPLVRASVRKVDRERWERMRPINEARYQQMLDFVAIELPGVFDAVDDGRQGKPCVDLFLDDRAVKLGLGCQAVSLDRVAFIYGELQPRSKKRRPR